MALENAAELAEVLRRRERLGRIFARHAYGMRAWVDLFSGRVAAIEAPEVKALVATLVADNARHMMLFRERAIAYGIDPDAYAAPAEGEVIYERISELDALDDALGYALGSLDHFEQLLSVYRDAATGDDLAVIEAVRADVTGMRRTLRGLVGPDAARFAAEAHELYRLRELVETPTYALAG
jgi:hypothetical protein